ncbi:MAG TPA: ComEC/Rec2 family competence protein [Candidatus Limnocylindrales bacterium]|nr:ComEC/Rec2 family competence protein [Candidatus Limnocylindrales bacterium]
MPASGWLAIGSVVAALVAPNAGALLVAVVAASLAAAGWPLPRRAGRRMLLGVALGAGVLAARLTLVPEPPPAAAAAPEGSGPWIARVESVAAPRDGSQVATLHLESDHPVAVAATLPRFPAVEPGTRVRVEGAIRPPPEGAYGDYLRRTGVAGTLRSRALERLPGADDPAGTVERLRRHAASALDAAIPEPEAGLASGIVIGLRDRVDRDLAADFTTVGASHVVAISGWNIAIVAACVAALCGRLSRRRRAVITAATIVAYVAFAGASPSVVRAATMAGVVLIARESGRSGRAAAALGWAAVLLLLVDPHLVSDAGFQLSALATAGILAWATPFAAWLNARRGRVPGWLTECLAVSIVAQLATLPVVLLSFGRLAVVSPIVNLGVVPLVAPAMAACAVALLGGLATLAGAPGLVATLLGLPAWFLLSLIVGMVEAGAALPFASATLEPPWNAVAAGGAAASIAGVGLARRLDLIGRLRRARATSRRRAPAVRPAAAGRRGQPSRAPVRAVAVFVAAAMSSLVLVAAHRPDGATRITVLDVGQGDAILVEGARGGRLLVDGGPDPDRLLVELDRRLPPWDRRLDALILTHPHEDHVAGLAMLLERYRVGRVFEPGMRGPGPGYGAWAAVLDRAGAPVRGTLATGDRLAVDDLRFDVLWPDPGRVPRDPPDSGRGINDVSIVLLGEVDGRRILLTGDVEDDVDPVLAGRGLPRIDFLKVAHHGSGTASTVAFLDVARPSLAVVSAGADNPYGHPARSTLDHLRETGATVLRTDTDGSVEVTFEASAMRVAASGGRPVAAIEQRSTASASGPRVPAPAFACAIPSGA